MSEKLTYEDVAAEWQVSKRTVRRWFQKLRDIGRLKINAPTRRTIRFTRRQADQVEKLRAIWLVEIGPRPVLPAVPVPAKIPAKTDGQKQTSKNWSPAKRVPKRPISFE